MSKKSRPTFFICSLACLLVATATAEDPKSTFPQPYNSEPDKTATPPAPQQALEMMALPDGFTATVFAAEPKVRNPIAMAWDPRGRMWVAENFTYAERAKRFDLDLRDRIIILQDADGDGVAEKQKVFADQLTMLTSVELGDGGVWAMCPPHLLFIPDRDGDDVPDAKPQVVLDGFTVAKNNYHNFANGLRWGPDGWLYGRCGHSCPGNIGKPGAEAEDRTRMEGGIFRYHPGEEKFEVLCHGTTNPWGHDFDRHGELFFINTVNGHLWHGIHGAHFREHFGASPNPGVYERLEMHADHWHYDTGQHWTKSRAGKANDFGGGHAHIGMMIYQAEQWPEAMRDKLYTMNMHGLRTNVELLERNGSGYVARHEPDIFLTADQWFRGIDLRQGPDGSVYMLDWSDTGECHDSTGVHRSSGRIFRISHGQAKKPEFADLENITAEGVRRLIEHPNVWFERQLRRQLVAGDAKPGAIVLETLRDLLAEKNETTTRLRALWALQAVGAADDELCKKLLADKDEHLRAWAIRLLVDDLTIDSIMGPRDLSKAPTLPMLGRLVTMAREDGSGLVRLTLASTLQRLDLDGRKKLGGALATRAEDATDHNLPSIVWYGLIPVGDADPKSLADIAAQTGWPQLQRWITRNLAGRADRQPQAFERLLTAAADKPEMSSAVLLGIDDAYRGQKQVKQAAAWEKFATGASKAGTHEAELVVKLSVKFGNRGALEQLQKNARDKSADTAVRRSALAALIAGRPEEQRQLCEDLLDDQAVAAVAVRGLAHFDSPEIGKKIAANYAKFAPGERSGVVEVLVSRASWAGALLDQIEAKKIPRRDLATFHARQVRAFKDKALDKRLADVWGDLRESSADKRELIEIWKKKLAPEKLKGADLSRGRLVYQQSCAACHRLYGEGGEIGPDLTGSGRKDLGYLVENIADPAATVGADFRMTVVSLKDGRVVTGVVEREDKKTLTLRQIAGQLSLAKGDIKDRKRPAVSMMPDGLFEALGEEEVRALIAYLQHDGQVPLPEKAGGQ